MENAICNGLYDEWLIVFKYSGKQVAEGKVHIRNMYSYLCVLLSAIVYIHADIVMYTLS